MFMFFATIFFTTMLFLIRRCSNSKRGRTSRMEHGGAKSESARRTWSRATWARERHQRFYPLCEKSAGPWMLSRNRCCGDESRSSKSIHLDEGRDFFSLNYHLVQWMQIVVLPESCPPASALSSGAERNK